MKNFVFASIVLGIILLPVTAQVDDSREPLTDPTFFPLAVWLQDPGNAPKYKDIGINVYVGLWRGDRETTCRAEETRHARTHHFPWLSVLRMLAHDLLDIPGLAP
jgi:hypothetical protein